MRKMDAAPFKYAVTNNPNCSCRHSQLMDGGAGDSSEHSSKNKKTVAKGLGINSARASGLRFRAYVINPISRSKRPVSAALPAGPSSCQPQPT
jgi:hypothetical protein